MVIGESAPAGSAHDEALERARWELAALTGRLRVAEAERDRWQRRYEGMAEERDRERAQLRSLQRSESYRLGRAVVSFVKNPVRTSPRLVRGVLRRLRGGSGTRPVKAGRAASRRNATHRLPVHLYVAIGLEPGDLRAFVRTVGQRSLVTMDHTPVVVTDSPTFSLLRNLGVMLEYVPDRLTWQQHRDDLPWDDLLSQRLTRLLGDHVVARTVVVDRREPPTLAQLLALDPEPAT
jgi:hypothetical protein